MIIVYFYLKVLGFCFGEGKVSIYLFWVVLNDCLLLGMIGVFSKFIVGGVIFGDELERGVVRLRGRWVG